MLSIVIPTFNYNVLPLVQELNAQALAAAIPFEIIVLDDASATTALIAENEKINLLPNCSYQLLPSNVGRSKIRNLLASKAKYNWLLFLDADTFPAHKNFITAYLPHLNAEEKVVYGGIDYQKEQPAKNMLLRWIYGNKREALSAETRSKAPYISLLTLNFAIHKSIFNTVSFNETIPNLRHEDTLFSYDLSKQNSKVEHITNTVYHLGLDTSEVFLKKSEEAIVGLTYLLENNLLAPDYAKVAKYYTKIKQLGLSPLLSFAFKIAKKSFKKNLLGSHPSMLIFDLYRLGYICALKK